MATADRYGRMVAVDRLMTVIMISGGIIVLVPLVLLVGYIIVEGVKALRFGFFVHDQAGITPTEPATAGGGAHALVGTIEEVGLALIWSLPLGLAAAVFLNESRSRWRRPVRIFVDAMSGLPSIVAGLFIFAVFILPYAHTAAIFGFNGFMASLALALLMLPTITRTVEVVLRLVPDGLREASLAMGASRARTTWSVVFPTARTGITTAVVLGIARAVGETAPLLFTSFGYDLMNGNPFAKPQESLPLFVYNNIRKPDLASIAGATPAPWCSWCWCSACSCWPASSAVTDPSDPAVVGARPSGARNPHERPRVPPGRPPAGAARHGDVEARGLPTHRADRRTAEGRSLARGARTPVPGSATTWCSRTSTWSCPPAR